MSRIRSSLTELYLPYPDKGDRLLRVFVPEHEEGERLPVIYMSDGQNLFDKKTSTFGCWRTREAVKAERKLSGKAAVIVGIHCDPTRVGRCNELSPKAIGDPLYPPEDREQLRPEGEVYDGFLFDTVMPAVERDFPVLRGRENTAFCGSSMGGLFAFYTALSHPEVFCAAGVFSPAFLVYSLDDLSRWISSADRSDMPYLYIYSGAGDELERQIFESTESVYDVLLEHCPPDMLNEVVITDNKHHESAWEPVFRDFLHIFLNGKQ